MDRQAIDDHDWIAFSNANRALPKTGQQRQWQKVRIWHEPDQPGRPATK
jgi:hypothetical protein